MRFDSVILWCFTLGLFCAHDLLLSLDFVYLCLFFGLLLGVFGFMI